MKVTFSLFVVTVPDRALLELSETVKVLVVKVELSMTSLKVATMLRLSFKSVKVPSEGEVEETVGAVVSSLKA